MCATWPNVEFISDTSDQIVANVTRNENGELERTPAVTLASPSAPAPMPWSWPRRSCTRWRNSKAA
jgi:hypothetical protein